MIIGTAKAEECEVHDSEAGYHRFTSEDGSAYGSFEVFFHSGGHMVEPDEDDDTPLDEWRDAEAAGWYWCAGFPGCLPDGEPEGPFTSSHDARADADENWELG